MMQSKRALRVLLGFAAAVGVALPASAHITLRPKEAPAGSNADLSFNVPHGCEGSATIALRVKIPDGVLSVKPQMKPGWSVDVKKRTLATPVSDDHGATISEKIDEVGWSGGRLPDNLNDAFGLQLRLPDTPGATLFFPLVQECEKGVHRWIEIPAQQNSGRLRDPAPSLKLTPKTP